MKLNPVMTNKRSTSKTLNSFKSIILLGEADLSAGITLSACDKFKNQNLEKDVVIMKVDRIDKVKETALKKMVGKEVKVQATVSMKSLDKYDRKIHTMCLTNIWVNNKPVFHMWLRSDRNPFIKDNRIQGNDMISFTGVVYEYVRANGTVSYSVGLKPKTRVKLVKAKYE